jgi:hypothetical protein
MVACARVIVHLGQQLDEFCGYGGVKSPDDASRAEVYVGRAWLDEKLVHRRAVIQLRRSPLRSLRYRRKDVVNPFAVHSQQDRIVAKVQLFDQLGMDEAHVFSISRVSTSDCAQCGLTECLARFPAAPVLDRRHRGHRGH